MLPNDAAGFAAWLRDPRSHKPGAHMPAFDVLADDEIEKIAAYLEALL